MSYSPRAKRMLVKPERFAFTMKINNKSKPTVYDYEGILNVWRDQGIQTDEYHYEREPNDSKKLHIHGIVSMNRNFYRKSLYQYGVHYKLKPLTDEKSWLEYCTKQTNAKDVEKHTIIKTN